MKHAVRKNTIRKPKKVKLVWIWETNTGDRMYFSSKEKAVNWHLGHSNFARITSEEIS